MRLWIVIALSLTLIFSLAGCNWFRQPESPSPDPQPGEKVEIPQEISQGSDQEPQLKVYMAEDGNVETLDFEEYIQGVVAAEMDPEWPVEALAAQAIKARTFALQKIAEQGTLENRDAHASTDIEEFQAYDASRINDNVGDAVEKTRGMVAVYQGEFVRGWFHAYCGGITATPSAGLNYQDDDPPYLEPVENPCRDYVDEDEEFWTATFSKEEVRTAVQDIANEDPGNFDSIDISSEENNRATVFTIGDIDVPAPELRLALGSTEMRSTWVETPEVSDAEVKFSGQGYGHGVGMCQWGAKGWADQGLSAEEIIKKFFTGVEIQKIWE